MRLGMLLRGDRTGLGVQTHGYWRHLKPDVSLLVDLHRCSGQHPDPTMYASDPNVTLWKDARYPRLDLIDDRAIERFLDQCDVVFSAETFYSWWLVERAREKGVLTVLAVNPEFCEFLTDPPPDIPEPDIFALPTPWLEGRIRRQLPGRNIVSLPVPVDRELLPYRHRPALNTILHTVGTGAMADRNGTRLLMDAMSYLKTPVTCTIKTQRVQGGAICKNTRIDMADVVRYQDLYRGDFDLMVMPRKFGGLCLPLNEALSCGMPVLMSDVSPQKAWLPPDLLLPARRIDVIETRTPVSVYEVNPVSIAERIDLLYERPDVFSELSAWADEWAIANSWEALLPRYRDVLAMS